MSLIFIAPNRDMHPWKESILAIDADLDVQIWPDIENNARVQFAIAWRQPPGVLQQYPNLKAVSSLGAGVDHILADETVPNKLPVSRIVSPNLVQQMKEYIFNAVLNYQRNTFTYFRQRLNNIWKVYPSKDRANLPVGVMGLGALGKPISRQLSEFGYTVNGWSLNKKSIPGVTTFAGDAALSTFIAKSKILICLLPLTTKTRNILNLATFRQMLHPGYLINVARGDHLVNEDLIYALDKEWLGGACLDVFEEEPLPENHPFWNRSNIFITPHISSITRPREVASQIVENYKRVLSGQALKNKADRRKGY